MTRLKNIEQKSKIYKHKIDILKGILGENKNMGKIIGFATQFYTLWDYKDDTNYRQDSYGKYHKTGITHHYYFIKNISKDLDKVKELYPNVPIDLELRGSKSFEITDSVKLPEGYFWAGKYEGKLIDEILEKDFEYCIWSADNYYGATSNYIKAHPKYIEHFKKIEEQKALVEQQKALAIENAHKLKVGDVVELEFLRNGYNGWFSDGGKIERFNSEDDGRNDYDRCWTDAKYEGIDLVVECGCKPVNGMYPYLMLIINGKAQRAKGKRIMSKVIQVYSTEIVNGNVKQMIVVE